MGPDLGHLRNLLPRGFERLAQRGSLALGLFEPLVQLGFLLRGRLGVAVALLVFPRQSFPLDLKLAALSLQLGRPASQVGLDLPPLLLPAIAFAGELGEDGVELFEDLAEKAVEILVAGANLRQRVGHAVPISQFRGEIDRHGDTTVAGFGMMSLAAERSCCAAVVHVARPEDLHRPPRAASETNVRSGTRLAPTPARTNRFAPAVTGNCSLRPASEQIDNRAKTPLPPAYPEAGETPVLRDRGIEATRPPEGRVAEETTLSGDGCKLHFVATMRR